MIISWVDQCDGGHDKNRRAARFDVGQNWAMQAGSYLGSRAVGASGSDMVAKWYGEVRAFHSNQIITHSSFLIILEKIATSLTIILTILGQRHHPGCSQILFIK